ncbi:MAG: penicillin-binding protein activator LpoB [Candidatus Latescibacterota bacterium]|nr:MAG: penicillin-binding protein activator LpoB [Candidatus Latescibacterota bacterium]
MKNLGLILAVIALVGLLVAAGCSPKRVSRIPEDSVTDLSGKWNDTDSRLVSEEMIGDCLVSPWKTRFVEQHQKKPTVIVGVVQNKSTEHIAIDTFIGDMERAFINSDEVTVVASAAEREQLREERQDQQTYASEETMKKWGRELGADFLLGGTISSILDEDRGEKVVFYQVDLTLIDLESNAKVWLGQKKIKKYIGRARMSY